MSLALPAIASAGAFVGIGIGGARTESTLSELGLYPPLEVAEGEPEYTGDEDFDSTDVSFDFAVGWMFGKYVGVELGYIEFGEASQLYPLPDSCNSFGCQSREWTATMELQGFRAFVIGNLPINDSVDAYGKLGAINWDADYNGFERNKIFVPGDPIGPRNDGITYDDDGTDLAVGIGAHLKTDTPFGVRAEFTYYDVDTTDLVWVLQLMGTYSFGE